MTSEKNKTLDSFISGYTDAIHHLDQVIIHDRQTVPVLEWKMPISVFEKRCNYFSVQWADGGYKKNGWYSRISVSVPSRQFLSRLPFYEAKLLSYKITRVEPAVDFIYPDKTLNQLDTVVKEFHNKVSVAYSNKGMQYEVIRKDYKAGSLYDPANGGFTSYIGTKRWQLVTYARKSKLTCSNCIHLEWRCLNTKAVKKITGISTIHDFLTFDHEKFWRKRMKYISEEAFIIDIQCCPIV